MKPLTRVRVDKRKGTLLMTDLALVQFDGDLESVHICRMDELQPIVRPAKRRKAKRVAP